jgi:electron transport complex protein RnfE
MNKYTDIFFRGIFKENPVLILMIGLCSVLAVSVTVVNALGMLASFSFVMIGSELVISAIRKWIPDSLRIPIFIIAIGTFTTMIQFLLAAYLPALDKSLGVFVPLIVVNCIIIGRVEAFSYKHTVFESLIDSVGMSLGYGLVIVSIAAIREVLGSGTILGHMIFASSFKPVLFFILPPGAFFVIGLEIAILNYFLKKIESKGATS